MKKITIYNIAFLCLALVGVGTLTAFDGSETDEQKIDAAYNELVATFNAEQDSLCKLTALEAATIQMNAEVEMVEVEGEGSEAAPKRTRPKRATASTAGTTTQPAATTPAPAVVKQDPPTGKKGKMSGGTTSSSTDKKNKMSGSSKSGASSNKKKNKMSGK